jgi:hypothetical protein
MKYEGYIVIDRYTGAIIGGYPRPGEAQHYTRLGEWTGEEGATLASSIVVRVEGEV